MGNASQRQRVDEAGAYMKPLRTCKHTLAEASAQSNTARLSIRVVGVYVGLLSNMGE